MSLTTRVGLLAGATALSLTGVGVASSADATNEELRAQVRELSQRVQELETTKGGNWLTDQRAQEVRALVQDVLADADTRASLLGSGMTAGYDDGFTIGSADGNFLLRINGQLQARWIYNYQRRAVADNNWDRDDLVGIANLGGVDGTYLGYAFLAGQPGIESRGHWVDGYFTPTNNVVSGYVDTVNMLNAIGGMSDSERDARIEAYMEANPGPRADLDYRHLEFLDSFLRGRNAADRNHFAENVSSYLGLYHRNRDGTPGEALGDFDNWDQYIGFVRGMYSANLQDRRRGDSHRSGWENARTKLWFSGHVVDPSWQYMIEGNFAVPGGGFTLLDAYIRKDCGNGLAVTFGQFKAPFMREQLVDARYQQAVERSLVNSIFTSGRTNGIMVSYDADMFRLMGSVNDGRNSQNVGWNAETVEYSFTARGEVLFAGNWDQFMEFRSPPGDEFGALLGVALHWQKEEFGTGRIQPGSLFRDLFPNNDEEHTVGVTVDASMKFGNANLFAMFVYQHVDHKRMGNQDQWGVVVQGGYHFTNEWEGFIRWEWADLDVPDVRVGGASVYSFDDVNVLTWGVNHYFSGHQVKWTADMGYAFNRVEFFAADRRAGWRSDTGGRDGQFLIRTQLQLLF